MLRLRCLDWDLHSIVLLLGSLWNEIKWNIRRSRETRFNNYDLKSAAAQMRKEEKKKWKKTSNFFLFLLIIIICDRFGGDFVKFLCNIEKCFVLETKEGEKRIFFSSKLFGLEPQTPHRLGSIGFQHSMWFHFNCLPFHVAEALVGKIAEAKEKTEREIKSWSHMCLHLIRINWISLSHFVICNKLHVFWHQRKCVRSHLVEQGARKEWRYQPSRGGQYFFCCFVTSAWNMERHDQKWSSSM